MVRFSDDRWSTEEAGQRASCGRQGIESQADFHLACVCLGKGHHTILPAGVCAADGLSVTPLLDWLPGLITGAMKKLSPDQAALASKRRFKHNWLVGLLGRSTTATA